MVEDKSPASHSSTAAARRSASSSASTSSAISTTRTSWAASRTYPLCRQRSKKACGGPTVLKTRPHFPTSAFRTLLATAEWYSSGKAFSACSTARSSAPTSRVACRCCCRRQWAPAPHALWSIAGHPFGLLATLAAETFAAWCKEDDPPPSDAFVFASPFVVGLTKVKAEDDAEELCIKKAPPPPPPKPPAADGDADRLTIEKSAAAPEAALAAEIN